MTLATGRDSDRFIVRLPDGMRDRIRAAADANQRSMNSEIVAALAEKFPVPEETRDLAVFIVRFLQERDVDLNSPAATDYAKVASDLWFAKMKE